jgi:hypothetical protein
MCASDPKLTIIGSLKGSLNDELDDYAAKLKRINGYAQKERSVVHIFSSLCSLRLLDCTVFGSHVARGLQYSAVHRVRNTGESDS